MTTLKCRTCHEPVKAAGTQCAACVWEDKQAREIAGTDEDLAYLFECPEPYRPSHPKGGE